MNRPFALFVFFAAAGCASAQVTLSTVQDGVSTPAGQIVSFGSVAAGWNVSDVVFNISYTGTVSPYYLTYFTWQQDTAFSVIKTDWQSLPVAIPAEGLSFTVRFEPNEVAKSDSATLEVGDASNPITVVLSGEGTPGFTTSIGKQALTAGATIPFGSVQSGSSQTVALTLANQTAAPLTVGAIVIQGSAFQLTGDSPAGISVPAGGSAALQIVFSPSATGSQQGTLLIGVARFPLAGVGLSPPPADFPAPSIQLTPGTLGSAQQGNLAIALASGAVAGGSGTVTLTFQSAVNGIDDDPTVCFADGTRSATFTVAEGASSGQFATGQSVSFGSGTTAGTLTFTAALGTHSAQATVTISAAPIAIDAAVAARNVACDPSLLYCTTVNVQLQINGWDNTRSVSEVIFHFFDQSGNPIPPASIPFDGGGAFQTYFAGSGLGGVFGLTAFFPITGDSNKVTTAVVALTNTAGTVESAEITF